MPHADLCVTKAHALLIDGVLVPAALLANGISIVKMEGVEEIHYFHIELDEHDVIVAEGVLAETYVEDDNRGMFHNVAEFGRLYPDARMERPVQYCAPRLEDGFALEALRRKLSWRAQRLRPDGTLAPASPRDSLDVAEVRQAVA